MMVLQLIVVRDVLSRDKRRLAGDDGAGSDQRLATPQLKLNARPQEPSSMRLCRKLTSWERVSTPSTR